MAGKLIVVEGIDGSGKGTQCEILAKELEAKGGKVHLLKYPDASSKYGEILDAFLTKKIELDAETQFLTFAADILKDRKKIAEWMAAGDFVVMDRYICSTIAYQAAHGMKFGVALKIANALEFLKPDAIILLNISAQTAVARKKVQIGENEIDRHDADKKLLKKVASGFLRMAKKNWLGNWHIVDGEKSKEDVAVGIKPLIEQLVK